MPDVIGTICEEARRALHISIGILYRTGYCAVVDVKLLLFTVLAGYVASAGHALLFAVGVEPPHDGVRRRGVSICGATLQVLNLQVQAC